jgi:hypothetical protein
MNTMSKKDQIYQLLSDGQPHRAAELVKITHRFSAAIHKLREDGDEIKTVQLGRNDFAYQLSKIRQS